MNMKRVMVLWMISAVAMTSLMAQNKIDDERMDRDIEIAENVLGTLIRQAFDRKRAIFPFDVEGNYSAGYGVTFRVPSQMWGGLVYEPATVDVRGVDGENVTIFGFEQDDMDEIDREMDRARSEVRGSAQKTEAKSKRPRLSSDSLKKDFDQKLIEAAKNFIADYGDMVTQLSPDERIIVTNRSAGQRVWVGSFVNGMKQSYLSVETTKGELNQFKQGKISRDQFLAKLKVVNSEMDDELFPDRELLSSIFNRLYRPDLSKTFYANESVYYEGLKDFGVIYYMKVYSSNQDSDDRYSMPTIRLKDLDRETRDKKVVELYPQFEKSIKEDILEYGRTLKSLKSEESLVFNITLTKCTECGIPAFVEYAIKASVLNDYSSGKVSKESALTKITTKKGPNQ